MKYHSLTIDGKEFAVSEGRYRALKQVIERRDTYRLFYAESGQVGFSVQCGGYKQISLIRE